MVQTLTRLSVQEEKQQILDNWDSSRLYKYFLKKNPELASRYDSLLAQYKSYLLLCALSALPLAVPSEEVDELWHRHLEMNSDYNKLTMALTGKILVHNPHLDGDEVDDSARQNLADASFAVYGKFVFDPSAIGCNNCDGNGCLTCHNGCKS